MEGLTRLEEEGYNYAHYYGAGSQKSYQEDYNGYSYAKDYYKDGGYLCPSDIFYGRPKRAANTYGKWKVIVNLPDEYYAKGKEVLIVLSSDLYSSILLNLIFRVWSGL